MRRRPVVVAPRRGPSLVGTVAKTAVIAGTATVVATGVSNAMSGGSDAAPAPVAAAPVAPAPVGLSPEQVQQLQQIAALKDQGILTEAEFNAQKAVILANT